MIDSDDKPTEMRWSFWDLAGITLYTAGTVLDQIDNGLRLLASHCGAAANYSRARKAEREAEWVQERERQILAKALDAGEVQWRPEDLT